MTRPGRALRTRAPTACAVLLLTAVLVGVPAGVRAYPANAAASAPFPGLAVAVTAYTSSGVVLIGLVCV